MTTATPTATNLPSVPEQARSVERQAKVLTAALRLLLDGGSAGVTHRRVAEESGSSPGAVRYYFRTREDLLAACLNQIESGRHAAAEQILKAIHEDATPDETARWALEIYFGEGLDDATVTGTVWSIMDCARESSRLSALLRDHRLAALHQLAELLLRCGYPEIAPSLVSAVFDGSALSTTLEAGTDAAETAMAELTPVLRAHPRHQIVARSR